jgi:stage V sporulation protein AF
MTNGMEQQPEQQGNATIADIMAGQIQPNDQNNNQQNKDQSDEGMSQEQDSGSQSATLSPQEVWTDEELRMKDQDLIPKDLDHLERVLEEKIGLNRSFDLIYRRMTFGSTDTAFLYCNGFVKDDVMVMVMGRLSALTEEQIGSQAMKSFMNKYIPHVQVSKTSSLNEAVDQALAGASAFFIHNEDSALIIDTKQFPVRSIEEPDLERVVRGSRDGFTETMLTNVTLVRRRIRDHRLKLEVMDAGKRTKTTICIGYINDVADLDLVKAVKDKIERVELDGLPLAEKQLEEAIVKKTWNPYPAVRYSERPDVVSAHLLEGHVAVFVDTSPSVMILPTTFFHHVQHAEEYRQTPFIGSYLRWVRYLGILASLFLLPLWMLLVVNPELKPAGLHFLGPSEPSQLPLLLQFLLVELGTDLMRMASVHTPTPLATAMGLVAAILIGDIAVKTGLFANEVILYMAVAAIGMFATPSYELGLANRIFRLVLLVSVAVWKIPGLVIATTLWIIVLSVQRSYNSPYMWPFIPFNAKAMYSLLIRKPVTSGNFRPSITKSADDTRQPT